MAATGGEIDKLFVIMSRTNASDLHLKAGSPPIMRVNQEVKRLESAALSDEQVWSLVEAIMPPRDRADFERTGNADFAYSLAGLGRFRVNVFRQRDSVSVAARRVRFQIPGFDELHLPTSVRKLASFDQGLCLVAGPTGSGKSTTLAALVDEINRTRRCHILTIEDPIEYLYRDDKAFVNQREVGLDVESFSQGLRCALREDADVILVGEMRDPETFETALQAAETGHLVFGTLHAANAAQSIGRILDLFPEGKHKQIRQLLVFNLKAVVVQMLMPGTNPSAKVVPAAEIMIVNPAIRKLIRDGDDAHIPDVIRSSRAEGMMDFNSSLVEIVRGRLVSEKTALEVAPSPEALTMALKGIVVSSAQGGILR